MRRVLSGLLVPLFALAGIMLFAGPAWAAPGLAATSCPTYGSGSCTGTGTVTVTVSSNGVVTLHVIAGGFRPGETVDVNVQPPSLSVGSFVANSSGVVDDSVTLPGGIAAGNHELILVGTVSGVTDTIPFTLSAPTAGVTPCAASYTAQGSDIVLAAAYTDTACATALPPSAATPSAATPSAAPAPSQLPFTGANVATGIAVAAIALAGGGLLVLSSRRRRRSAWGAK